MKPIIKTLVIKKKGRKYFDCTTGKFKAKLLINDISMNLEIDKTLRVHVVDISERSKYGVVIKFIPLTILGDSETEEDFIEALEARNEAERWLGYAESDVKRGRYQTNAINKALRLCPAHNHLAERFISLKTEIRCLEDLFEAERWLRYAEDDVNNGKYDTNAITKAIRLAQSREILAERLALLQDRVKENRTECNKIEPEIPFWC